MTFNVYSTPCRGSNTADARESPSAQASSSRFVPPSLAEAGAYDYAELVKSSSVSVSSSAADDGDSTTVESSQCGPHP